MTDYKISQLTAKTTPGSGDLLPLVDVSDTSTPPAGSAGSDKKVTFANLAAAVAASLGLLVKQAATPVAGVALVNSTPTILSWTAPNDGLQHRFQVFASMDVTSPETGGNILVAFTVPSGTSAFPLILPGGQSAGYNYDGSQLSGIAKAGTTVQVNQSSALSGGAATLWAEIWGA